MNGRFAALDLHMIATVVKAPNIHRELMLSFTEVNLRWCVSESIIIHVPTCTCQSKQNVKPQLIENNMLLLTNTSLYVKDVFINSL